jgi:hypothetical protein
VSFVGSLNGRTLRPSTATLRSLTLRMIRKLFSFRCPPLSRILSPMAFRSSRTALQLLLVSSLALLAVAQTTLVRTTPDSAVSLDQPDGQTFRT